MSQTPSSAPQRGGFRRKAVGGAAIGLLVLGAWFGGLFRGFGWGSGDGTGEGTGTGVGEGTGSVETSAGLEGVGADQATPADVSVAVDRDAMVRGRRDEAPRTPAETLVVMLYEGGYRLPKRPIDVATLTDVRADQFESATLEQVIEQAKVAKGNDTGIRVLVLRHGSSTVGAQSTLYEALHAAGLQDGEIHRRSGYVD